AFFGFQTIFFSWFGRRAGSLVACLPHRRFTNISNLNQYCQPVGDFFLKFLKTWFYKAFEGNNKANFEKELSKKV
ncbi:hypothetical protein, partial [Chroococcidiopsis sp. TS-821]|uniref:hypothetical protein n=1 Tax=Chroococcidiopsis sp. TS-821 TaxID=1378066 RepID=UPI001AF01C25